MIETFEETDVVKINTGVKGADENDYVIITNKAIEVINNVRLEHQIGEEFALRLGTRPGGCSGISYALGFDKDITEYDRIINVKDIKLVIDDKSIFYLMGVTLDYTDGPEGSGFVFINPNSFSSCGCSG